MSLVRVRFVITGGCHNLYSGRQFQQVVPLVDGSGPTLVSGVLNRVRSEWPGEFSEMKEQVQTCAIKMLKVGELLSPNAPFSQYLTQHDIATAVDDVSKLPPETEKSPIIIHLVFQQHPAAAPQGGEGNASSNNNADPSNNNNNNNSSNNTRRDRTDDRPQNSGGCCTVM